MQLRFGVLRLAWITNINVILGEVLRKNTFDISRFYLFEFLLLHETNKNKSKKRSQGSDEETEIQEINKKIKKLKKRIPDVRADEDGNPNQP